jgi:hypothetical protein
MENTIKMDLKGTECEDMVLIQLADDKVQLHCLVNIKMNMNKVSKICTNNL